MSSEDEAPVPVLAKNLKFGDINNKGRYSVMSLLRSEASDPEWIRRCEHVREIVEVGKDDSPEEWDRLEEHAQALRRIERVQNS